MKTKIEHTPGPWVFGNEAVWSTHPSVSGAVTKGARTNHVCAASSRLKMPESERIANGRLIAAAPMMYQAIKEAYDSFGGMHGNTPDAIMLFGNRAFEILENCLESIEEQQ